MKQVPLLLLGGTLALPVFLAPGLTTSADEKNQRPTIKKLGTLDLLMVETTPVVFKDRLYRFEYVRANYPANQSGTSYFRFIDVATGKVTSAFARGQHLGCAFVEGDTVYAFGVDRWGGPRITVFRSKDLERWQERLALHLPGWELFNTSVCKADGRYVMAIEVGGPKEVVGAGPRERGGCGAAVPRKAPDLGACHRYSARQVRAKWRQTQHRCTSTRPLLCSGTRPA